MIILALSAALVAAVPLAFAHGHASGLREADAETLAFLKAKRAQQQKEGPRD